MPADGARFPRLEHPGAAPLLTKQNIGQTFQLSLFNPQHFKSAHHKLTLLVSSVSGIVARNLSWYDRGTSSGE